jgi:hypothetical protein
VHWSGPDIVVFNDVLIRPPYRVENVEVITATCSSGKQRELDYVKKLVSNRLNLQKADVNSSSETSTATA